MMMMMMMKMKVEMKMKYMSIYGEIPKLLPFSLHWLEFPYGEFRGFGRARS
jgi:hypothetical protein